MSPGRSREVLQLALPIIGGMTSQNLLNLVDAWMVGALGPTALAATGLAGFVHFMAFAFISGFAPAVQAMVSRRVGEGQQAALAQPLNGALLLSLALGLPITLLLVILAPGIMNSLTADTAVASEGEAYLQYRLLGVVAVGMNFAFRGYWSAVNLTRLYLRTLVTMHALNIVLSYGLIHGHLGLPAMGTAGAGLGSSLATIAGTAMYFMRATHYARAQGFLRERPPIRQLTALLQLGVPSAVQQLLFAAGFLALFWIIARIGTPELAVANVLITMSLALVLPAIGFGLAAATLAGQALGRGDHQDARRWAWDSYRVALWVFTPLALILLLAPDAVLGLFLRDAGLVQLGRLPLQFLGASVLIDGLGVIMMQALLGVGAATLVLKVAVGLQWLLFLPCAYMLGPVLGGGLLTLWLAMGAYRLVQACLFTFAWERKAWTRLRV